MLCDDVDTEIRVPTLVIHRADARGFRVEHGRYLAEHIAGSKYVELAGIDKLVWAGDQDAIVGEIEDFEASDPRAGPRPRGRPVHGHRGVDAVGGRPGARPTASMWLNHWSSSRMSGGADRRHR
jgi:hypothetical protein